MFTLLNNIYLEIWPLDCHMLQLHRVQLSGGGFSFRTCQSLQTKQDKVSRGKNLSSLNMILVKFP